MVRYMHDRACLRVFQFKVRGVIVEREFVFFINLLENSI